MAEIKYIVWCEERSMWWQANKSGYTDNMMEAGRYDWNEAIEIVSQANRMRTEERMVRAPECESGTELLYLHDGDKRTPTIICYDCENEFQKSDCRRKKYEPSLWVCDDCASLEDDD